MLNFSRGQRNGLIVLMSLIVTFAILPKVIDFPQKQVHPSFSEFEKAIENAKLPAKEELPHTQSKEIELFDFNPNTANERELERLGLSEKQRKQILNYRRKKGYFYKKEDFKKMYAIDEATYKRLEAHIVIPRNKKAKNKPVGKKNEPKENSFKAKKVLVELNSSSVEDLQEIKGIGKAFSKRIVEYRLALGGFIEKTQLLEVYGIDEEKFQQIEDQVWVEQENIKQIRINYASAKEFETHPYFSKKQAKAIVKNRTFEGSYKSLSDFKKRLSLSDEFMRKVQVYLEL